MNNIDFNSSTFVGKKCYKIIEDLYPICRSITGPGLRSTLEYIKGIIPKLAIHSIKSGEKVFDWKVPDEWFFKRAFIEDERGNVIVDSNKTNLHVVNYSIPINRLIGFDELNKHLFSLPHYPDAIPYMTSYYKRDWGFCLSENERRKIKKDKKYRVVVDSKIKPGKLNYGEIVLPGKSKKEIFFSTYICHPSMANNELSGPSVMIYLILYVMSLTSRNYSYRFIFIPEMIGSLVYLKKNYSILKKNIFAGFNISCVGDTREYSYIPSRCEISFSDQICKHVLKHIDKDYKTYKWLDRGSDERNFCAPGFDLPVVTICRSKFGEFPEYHTSKDDLSLVSAKGLGESFSLIKKIIDCIEYNRNYKSTVKGEPQLGKRNLYPMDGSFAFKKTSNTGDFLLTLLNFISYCDGKMNLLEIANKMSVSMWSLFEIIEILRKEKLIK